MKRIFLIILLVPCFGAAPKAHFIPTPPIAKGGPVVTNKVAVPKLANFHVKVKNAPKSKKTIVRSSPVVTKSAKIPRLSGKFNVVVGGVGCDFPFPKHEAIVTPVPTYRVVPKFNSISDYMEYVRSKGKAK